MKTYTRYEEYEAGVTEGRDPWLNANYYSTDYTISWSVQNGSASAEDYYLYTYDKGKIKQIGSSGTKIVGDEKFGIYLRASVDNLAEPMERLTIKYTITWEANGNKYVNNYVAKISIGNYGSFTNGNDKLYLDHYSFYVTSIQFNSGAGNDDIQLGFDSATFKRLGFPSKVFYLGSGNDSFSAGSDEFSINVNGGAGDDDIYGRNLTVYYDVARVGVNVKVKDIEGVFPDAGFAAAATGVGTFKGAVGVDDLFGIDKFVFKDYSVELHQLDYIVNRKADGKASMSLKIDGKTMLTKTAYYDDALPIAEGDYDGILRTNPGHNKDKDAIHWNYVVEFFKLGLNANGWTGKSSVKDQTAVQLHPGSSTIQSQGCIVSSGFFTETWDLIKKFGYKNQTVYGIEFLDTVTNVKIHVNGEVLQPKFSMTSKPGAFEQGSSIITEKTNTTKNIYFSFKDAGLDKSITKSIDVYFKLSGDAKYGKDFVFSSDVTHVDKRGALTDLFKVTLDANKAEDFFQIKAVKDNVKENPETLWLKIVDLSLFNGKTEFDISKNSPGSLTVIERKLIGNDSYVLNILDDFPHNKMAADWHMV